MQENHMESCILGSWKSLKSKTAKVKYKHKRVVNDNFLAHKNVIGYYIKTAFCGFINLGVNWGSKFFVPFGVNWPKW